MLLWIRNQTQFRQPFLATEDLNRHSSPTNVSPTPAVSDAQLSSGNETWTYDATNAPVETQSIPEWTRPRLEDRKWPRSLDLTEN